MRGYTASRCCSGSCCCRRGAVRCETIAEPTCCSSCRPACNTDAQKSAMQMIHLRLMSASFKNCRAVHEDQPLPAVVGPSVWAQSQVVKGTGNCHLGDEHGHRDMGACHPAMQQQQRFPSITEPQEIVQNGRSKSMSGLTPGRQACDACAADTGC